MWSKTVRVLLILTAVFAMAYYLPAFYQKSVEKRPYKTMIYFSEVSHDFIVSREEGDTIEAKSEMKYYDSKGKELGEKEYMKLLPFNNTRRLKLMGEFPDSLNGVELTPEIVKMVKRGMLMAESSYTLQLDPLFESESGHRGVRLPEDMFRINSNGIEFIDCKTVKVNREKSDLFNKALVAAGFVAPSKGIYGIPSTIKRQDDGYFIVDKTGQLFQLKMIKGKPFVKKIPFEGEIKNIKCHSSGDLYCHIFTTDSIVYALDRDYDLHKLPLENVNGRYILSSNYFYNTYKVNDKDKSTLYVLDPDYNFVAKHTEDIDHYSVSEEARIERSIFPFKVMLTPGMAHFIPIPNPIKDFYVLNLICAGLFLLIKLIRRRKVWRIAGIVDLLIVLATGVYGFVAVFAFPARKY